MLNDDAAPRRFPWRPCLLVFLVALVVRLYFMFRLVPGDALLPSSDWELDAIAMSLVRTGQFANPYIEPTGRTAHLAPIPPLLLAAIYRVFGITVLGGILAWLSRMFFQSAIWGLLPWIGERTGLGSKAGLTGGLAGALFPQWLAHGEALAAVLMGILVVAIMLRWRRLFDVTAADAAGPAGVGFPSPVSALLLGAAFGVSFHVQPVFLLVFLGYLGFELWRRSDRGKWRSAGLVLAAAFAVCLPWGVRNYRALDAVVFVRSNLGLELRMGNHEGATANISDLHFDEYHRHPRTSRAAAIELRDMGEVAYMRESRREAMAWIGAHPGEFLRLTAKRIRYFWLGPLDHPATAFLFAALTGLAMLGAVQALRSLPAARSAALLLPLLTFPLVYYLVPWQRRYRFPIEWILFLLAGAAVWGWQRSRSVAPEAVEGPSRSP